MLAEEDSVQAEAVDFPATIHQVLIEGKFVVWKRAQQFVLFIVRFSHSSSSTPSPRPPKPPRPPTIPKTQAIQDLNKDEKADEELLKKYSSPKPDTDEALAKSKAERGM